MNVDAAKDAAERIVRLLKDPEPGLLSWNMFLATAFHDLSYALCPPENRTPEKGVDS